MLWRRRPRSDEDFGAEIEAHIALETDRLITEGIHPEEARRLAVQRFGNVTAVRERFYESGRVLWLDHLRQDLSYAARILRKAPGFTLTATFIIALGIGAATAAFTLLDHVLLRPLPFSNPEELVMLHEIRAATGSLRMQTSPPNFLDWRAMNKSFDSMGAYFSILFSVNLSGRGNPVRLQSAVVNSDVFKTLGVRPAAGRIFTADDDEVGRENVVLLSNSLAAALFGGAAAAVGQNVSLDNQTHTIIGVMEPGFAFPSRDAQLWRPLRFSPALLSVRRTAILYAVARLRPGVSMEQARADMDVIARRLQQAYPGDNAGSEIAVVKLREMISPQERMLVVGVFGAAFCLLLIACTNLANVLFARRLVRRQEIAVRIAIGAGRARLIRQLLTESLVLTIAGGVLGMVLAAVAAPSLALLVPAILPVGATPQPDWRVLAFAGGLTCACSIAFGVAPAFRSCGNADISALRARSAAGGRTDRLRGALVLAEIAGTVTLLIGAGLLVKALWRVQAVDPGFRTEGVLTLRTALPMPRYAAASARRDFYSRVLTGARALPGVASVAYVSYHPMEPASGRFAITAPGVADDPLTAPRAIIHFVTPDFFATLGIPLRRGRTLSDRDDAQAPFVALISESLARSLWPGQDPVGRTLNVSGVDRTVAGVAGDIVVRRLEGASDPQIYLPAEQLATTSTYYAPRDLLIRASGDPLALAPALRRIIHEADPEQAVSDVRLLEDVIAFQTAPRRAQLQILGVFTVIAFLLAAVGIHGLLSFAVSMRTQEVGVRVALGARRRDIAAMFLRQGLLLGAGGIAIAVPLAYMAANGIRALLFGVEPNDPLIYAAAALLALTMTFAGSLHPALRAARVDPAITIRSE